MKKINSIVACSLNNGIGKNGDLPWRLMKEMKHFAKITATTSNPEMQNAIVMGRKTWQSIPVKRRPLANRMNVVLSKTMKVDDSESSPHHVFDDLIAAIDFLNKQEQIERIFVIGGEQVYRAALELKLVDRIYLTRILKEFDCDAYYPRLDENEFHLIQTDEIPIGIQEENELKYEYLIYERKLVEV